jgi:flagellar motor switch protein FliM
MGKWKEFTDDSVQQLWLAYCEKKMEVEALQEINAKLIAALVKIRMGGDPQWANDVLDEIEQGEQQ